MQTNTIQSAPKAVTDGEHILWFSHSNIVKKVSKLILRTVERDALRSRGSNLSPGASAYQRIISNNYYAHHEQGDNPRQEKRRFDGVLYKLWPLLIPWSAASRFLVALREPKQIDLAGRWLAQHAAPVRAKPDSRPHLEGRSRNTRQALHLLLIPPFSALTHTSTHAYQFPSCPWASALDS